MEAKLSDSDSHRSISVSRYVCALVDVLGQQAELRQLDLNEDFLSLGAIEAQSDFSKTLERCYSTILNFRHIIEESLARWYPTVDDIHLADAAFRKRIEAAVSQRVTTRSFSDLMIVYASVENSDTAVPLAPIWRTVCALMFCQLRALAEGRTMRGGIDLGLGFEFRQGDLYGPVLSRVYSMESDVAQYPRILVGNRLIEFVEKMSVSPEGEFGGLNCSMAKEISRAFIQDVDGHWFLDFAGRAHFEWIKATEWPCADLFARGHAFVRAECERLRIDQSSRLAFRYAHLNDYLQNCAPIWVRDVSTFRDLFSRNV